MKNLTLLHYKVITILEVKLNNLIFADAVFLVAKFELELTELKIGINTGLYEESRKVDLELNVKKFHLITNLKI